MTFEKTAVLEIIVLKMAVSEVDFGKSAVCCQAIRLLVGIGSV